MSFSFPDVRSRVSDAEWSTRVDLACAYRLANQYRWTDQIYTHFTAKVPGEDHFLINPYGVLFDEVTASCLVKVDYDGRVLLSASGIGINQAGFVIHSCVHRARPELHAVLHTHSRAGAAVSAMKCGLLAISQHAMMVQADVAYHDYEGIALYLEEQERMARDLGPTAKAMILRNHGLLALGKTVREAFEVMYYLDASCQIQVDACAGGMHNVHLMSQQAAKTASTQFKREGRPAHYKDWPALLRMLDRKGIRYAE